MAIWILSLMMFLQPSAPWKDTYGETAKVISEVSSEKPLFSGSLGKEKTAVLLVSLAWFESRFDPKAVGDHGKSFGLYQQQGMGKIEDSRTATLIAIEQIKISFRVCSSHPIEEKLGWYAAGGNDCERGLKESRHRMNKAFWMLSKYPYKEEKHGEAKAKSE